MSIDPHLTEKLVLSICGHVEKMLSQSKKAVLLCSASIRRHVRKISERVVPQLSVLSMAEVPSSVEVKSFAVVSVDARSTAAAKEQIKRPRSGRVVEEI